MNQVVSDYSLGYVVCPCGNKTFYVMTFKDVIKCSSCGSEAGSTKTTQSTIAELEQKLAETKSALAVHLAVAEDDPILITPLEKQMYDLQQKLADKEAQLKRMEKIVATAQAYIIANEDACMPLVRKVLLSDWQAALTEGKEGNDGYTITDNN